MSHHVSRGGKASLLSLVGFLFTVGTAVPPISACAESPKIAIVPRDQSSVQIESAIRVMSYNIHYGVGMDGKYNIHRIAGVIRSSGADIVGLQEVDVHFGERSHFDDQVHILEKELHMHVYYAPIYNFAPRQGDTYRRMSGQLLLSKFPIVSADNHQLARLPNLKPEPTPEVFPPMIQTMPGFADVSVRLHGQDVKVYNTHLDYRTDKRVRILQIHQMMSIIPTNGQNQILLGDFNVSRTEPELEPINQRFNDSLASCIGQCRSYPADKPTSLLDYVFVSPDVNVQSAKVLAVMASDHRPVVAALIV